MSERTKMSEAYAEIRAEAERLAGANDDLAQRASVYHHLYRHSKGNHVFPLIAAHGAMWAGGYFRFGMRIGSFVARLCHCSAADRKQRMELLADFADAFRNVNRLVCIETYTTYHFTKHYGHHHLASDWIEPVLLTQLNLVHKARTRGDSLSTKQKRDVFETFFRNEQKTIVGPKINSAGLSFDWPLMRFIALRPYVKFAYMPGWGLLFRDFCNENQRIRNGLRAIDIAQAVGLDHVERTLAAYQVLPELYLQDADRHFEAVKQGALAI